MGHPAEWHDVFKPDFAGAAREIPRPAGENAGLRDDAFRESARTTKADFPQENADGARESSKISAK